MYINPSKAPKETPALKDIEDAERPRRQIQVPTKITNNTATPKSLNGIKSPFDLYYNHKATIVSQHFVHIMV